MSTLGKTWKMKESTKRKIAQAHLGKKASPETKKKLSESHKGKPLSKEHAENLKNALPRGNKHWKWIEDRTQLSKRDVRNDTAYQDWRKQVWTRDNFKCKIDNCDCSGNIEAHHILRWADHPELRYEINNGITLCKFHHPRKKEDEMKLSDYFKKLIGLIN
ncbi:HNH endonuclease [Candidatus Woesebacteria bacterium]|nr:HNH endonuclease [Candidatus Woesebacteria bacterium]